MYFSIVAASRIAAACPLCADNLANDPYGKNPTQLGRGFFWSIIFMMVLPFATVATVATRILIAKRRAARRAAAGPAPGEAATRTGAPGALPDVAS